MNTFIPFSSFNATLFFQQKIGSGISRVTSADFMGGKQLVDHIGLFYIL